MARWPKVTINTKDLGMCFGCGQDNPFGLRLKFDWDGQTATTHFMPTRSYQGWPGYVHGGIIVSMLDEVMAYAVKFSGTMCVTVKIQASFKRMAPGVPRVSHQPEIARDRSPWVK